MTGMAKWSDYAYCEKCNRPLREGESRETSSSDGGARDMIAWTHFCFKTRALFIWPRRFGRKSERWRFRWVSRAESLSFIIVGVFECRFKPFPPPPSIDSGRTPAMVTAFFVFLFRWRRFKLRERITPQTAVSAYRNKSTLLTSASIKPVYQTMPSDPPIMIECSCAGKLGSNVHQFWCPRATIERRWGR